MYLVSIDPQSGEQPTYNRFSVTRIFDVAGPMVWKWVLVPPDSGTPIQSTARVRAVVDGVPGVWVSSVAGVYSLPVTRTNGHHVIQPETDLAGTTVFGCDYVVNDTAAPLPVQAPWVVQRRVPGEYALPQLAPRQITSIPTAKPYAAKMKARAVQPYTTRLTAASNGSIATLGQLYVRRWAAHSRNVFFRRFWQTPKGDTIVVAEQKYSREHSVSTGSHQAGLQVPTVVVRDGDRAYGALGYTAKLLLRRNGKGLYFIGTEGRIGFLSFVQQDPAAPSGLVPGESYINTFAGWRTNRPTWGSEQGWELVGDWSRVPGVKRFHEPWGLAVALRKADASIDNRDGLDLWVADTLNHRLLYLDAWAAHADVSAETGRPSVPQFPPAGYAFPGHVGVAQVVHLLGNTDQTPSGPCHEPWDCEIRPQDGRLYYSNFAGDSIWSVRTDGTDAQMLIGRTTPRTDAQLGISSRLGPSGLSLATLRTNIVDGPAGTATVTRPQAIAFDAAGDLFFVERYTYALRKYSFTTGMVTTIKLLPVSSLGGGSSETHDFAMAIDVHGTVGPAGDVFLAGWAGGAHWRVSADGTFAANLFGLAQRTARNGPADVVDPPNYAWGIAVQEGRIVWAGNDSGSQFVEVTKRLASDPASFNQALYDQGASAWRGHFLLTHGHDGYGELGYPNVEQMGAWTDAAIVAYATAWGVPAALHAALTYWIRWTTIDFDYTAADTTPPAAPAAPLQLTKVIYS